MWFLLGLAVTLLSPSTAIVEEFLNTSVQPCDDFYQHACGRWSAVNKDVEHGDILSLLAWTMNEKIADLLEANPAQQDVPAKVRTFYSACRGLKEYSLSTFLGIVRPKSGWAAVPTDTWTPAEFNWLDIVAELRKYGVQVFLELTVLPKWDNTSVNSMYLDVVGKGSGTKNTFLDLLEKAAIPRAEALVDELVAFEGELNKILPVPSDILMESDDAEEVVLGYLSETLPTVNWVRYLSKVFGRELDLYTPMIVQNCELMAALVEFLENSKRDVVCNYIMVKFLEFIDQHAIEDISRNECVTALHQSMPLAVGYLIEHHFYDPDYDQVVHDLLNFYKVEFLTHVSKLYEKYRGVLLYLYSKASVMDLQIGNAKRNLTLAAVTNYYKNLRLQEGQFHGNLLTAFAFKTQKDLESLKGAPVDIAYQWSVTASPFYVQTKNRVVVPLSLLQERILSKDSTDKYSVLAFIIAHEFVHAFDVTGINYDYDGSIIISAVSQNTQFRQRVGCVRQQMGPKGVGEKIADLGGIRLAFNAYGKTVTELGKSLSTLDGSGRSLGQIFFIEFAQFFCGINKKSPAVVGADVHEPDEMRVRQALMHFEEFAKTFECPLNSKMNPSDKCRVW